MDRPNDGQMDQPTTRLLELVRAAKKTVFESLDKAELYYVGHFNGVKYTSIKNVHAAIGVNFMLFQTTILWRVSKLMYGLN